MFQGKIVCVGMNKSGTTSIRAGLKLLGFGPLVGTGNTTVRHNDLVLPILLRGDYEPALAFARDYRIFKDRPWNIGRMPELMDERYPDSRFILTERDPESWWRSIHHWITVASPGSTRFILGHLRVPSIDRDAMIAAYLAHNEALKSHFAGTGRLLVMDLARGDGWPQLCPFLGVPLPNKPFPESNRQTYTDADRQKGERRRQVGAMQQWAHRFAPLPPPADT
jgi:hypothetical protein